MGATTKFLRAARAKKGYRRKFFKQLKHDDNNEKTTMIPIHHRKKGGNRHAMDDDNNIMSYNLVYNISHTMLYTIFKYTLHTTCHQ